MTTKQETTKERDHETTTVVLSIAQRQWAIRREMAEVKRQMKDLVAAKREQLRRLEDDLAMADDEWASPVIQGELF